MKLKKLVYYWRRGSSLKTSPLNDNLTIVWRLFPVKIFQNDKFVTDSGVRKRGFVVRRVGTFCGELYHDLKWYRRFVKLHRFVRGKDARALKWRDLIKK